MLRIDAQEEARERRRRAGAITPAIRRAVVGRRRKCPECGAIGPLEVDHKRPVRFGGKSTPDNLRPLCPVCNRSRGDGTRPDPKECRRCHHPYRRAREGQDPRFVGMCPDCRRWVAAWHRKAREVVVRRRASEWRRKRALEARQAWRRRERGWWD